jgi:hypothetical protein
VRRGKVGSREVDIEEGRFVCTEEAQPAVLHPFKKRRQRRPAGGARSTPSGGMRGDKWIKGDTGGVLAGRAAGAPPKRTSSNR